jgi:hypothetical protein
MCIASGCATASATLCHQTILDRVPSRRCTRLVAYAGSRRTVAADRRRERLLLEGAGLGCLIVQGVLHGERRVEPGRP